MKLIVKHLHKNDCSKDYWYLAESIPFATLPPDFHSMELHRPTECFGYVTVQIERCYSNAKDWPMGRIFMLREQSPPL